MNDLTTYQLLRPSIKTGDAMAFNGKGPISWAIKTWTRSPYSHIAMCMWVRFHDEARLMLGHATMPSGVVLIHASQYLAEYKGSVDLYRINGPKAEALYPDYGPRMADWVAQQTGREYDKGGVAQFVAPIFQGSAEKFFCSELYQAAWNSVGADLPQQVDPATVVEWDLFTDHVKVL